MPPRATAHPLCTRRAEIIGAYRSISEAAMRLDPRQAEGLHGELEAAMAAMEASVVRQVGVVKL